MEELRPHEKEYRRLQIPPKNVFEKLRCRDGLTVGLRCRDGLVWTVGLTVEIKLRFHDGLVWTVGLTYVVVTD